MNQNSTANCSGKRDIPRHLVFDEGFKVLRMEIGCNYVQDKRKRKFWVESTYAWPNEHTKRITIP